MKQTLINAGILTALFVGLWAALDIPLRGYPSTPDDPPIDSSTPAATPQTLPSSQQTLMDDGLRLLYADNDPNAAASKFSAVLDQDGAHYGATFQHAKALDMAGDIQAAHTEWTRFLTMADESQDAESMSWALERIEALSPTIDHCNALMERGLSMLHNEQNPRDAIGAFSEVLSQWPTHYGAAYQLAQALERDGQTASAKEAWERVAVNAHAVGAHDDAAAAQSAIERLQQTPPEQ